MRWLINTSYSHKWWKCSVIHFVCALQRLQSHSCWLIDQMRRIKGASSLRYHSAEEEKGLQMVYISNTLPNVIWIKLNECHQLKGISIVLQSVAKWTNIRSPHKELMVKVCIHYSASINVWDVGWFWPLTGSFFLWLQFSPPKLHQSQCSISFYIFFL